MSPYPAAWSELHLPTGEILTVKVFETEKLPAVHSLTVGSIQTDGKKYLHVAVADGFIGIRSLQLAGKKRLAVDELLRGFHLTDEARFR